MYLEILCASVLAGAPAPTVLKSRIISASVFKPGLVFIVREVQVPAGSGSYRVDFLPDALDGSFWYSSKGVKVNQVETRMKVIDKDVSRKAVTIMDYLLANVGKKVSFFVTRSTGNPLKPLEMEKIAGILVDASPNGSLTLKTADGSLRTVGSSLITKLNLTGLSNTLKQKVRQADIGITFDANGATPGVIEFITMENCAAWTCSYMINLNNEADATVVGKAQIALGGIRFKDTDVSVVAGMPNMPSTSSNPNNPNETPMSRFDLASGFGSLVAYLRGSQEGYRSYRNVNVDPYTYIPTLANQNRNSGYSQSAYYARNEGYGGMGGVYGGAGSMMDAMVSAAEPYGPSGGNDNRNTIDSMARVEDVFAYPVGKLTMDAGERITRLLFDDNANYKRIYRWQLSESRRQYYDQPTVVNRVSKVLRVTNKSKTPWTAGKCIVTKDGVPLASIEMPFTAVGQDANLELGVVQDIVTGRDSKETGRDNVTVFDRSIHSAVTVEETLKVSNARLEPIELEVQFTFEGMVLSSDAESTKALGLMLNSLNPQTLAVWTVKLKPGETKDLHLTRKTVL